METLRHEGLEHAGGECPVVIGREYVPDVMHQGADHVLIRAIITVGTRGALETMLEPIDGHAERAIAFA